MNRQEQRKLKHNPLHDIERMKWLLMNFAMVTNDKCITSKVAYYIGETRKQNANLSAIRDDMKRYFHRVDSEVATFERENGITTPEQLADVLVGE